MRKIKRFIGAAELTSGDTGSKWVWDSSDAGKGQSQLIPSVSVNTASELVSCDSVKRAGEHIEGTHHG